jgi:pimeloyl-ACP methyl ester carboxylesterase
MTARARQRAAPWEWDIRESGPADADHTVLLLPGTLATAAFYDDLMAATRFAGESIKFVAATLPGQGGTTPSENLSIEGYARLAGKLAADRGCSAVVGHSMGANVAIEMAAAGEFSAPLVLLAPSFSRQDESMFPRVLDRLGSVLGYLPFAAMLKVIGRAVKGGLPADRHDALVAELQKNDPRVVRRHIRLYLAYLDRHGSVAPRLCDAGTRAWGLRRPRRNRPHRSRAACARGLPSGHAGHDPRCGALHPQYGSGPGRRDRRRGPLRLTPTIRHLFHAIRHLFPQGCDGRCPMAASGDSCSADHRLISPGLTFDGRRGFTEKPNAPRRPNCRLVGVSAKVVGVALRYRTPAGNFCKASATAARRSASSQSWSTIVPDR